MALKGHDRRVRGRRGYTLAELTVTLAVLVLLLALSLRALAGVARTTTGLQERGAWLEAARASRWVLRSELGAGEPGRDWRLNPPDSVGLRAFRGVALVCSALDDSTFAVRVRSARLADPAKDSVLVLRGDGVWDVGRLVAIGPAAPDCLDPSAGRVERWRVAGLESRTGPEANPVLLRLFEAGSYHVAGATLRYRRGRGGAQPLSEAVLRGARLVGDTSAGIFAGLEIEAPGGAGGAWTVPLARAR